MKIKQSITSTLPSVYQVSNTVIWWKALQELFSRAHRAHSYNPVFHFSVFQVCIFIYKYFLKDVFATYLFLP